MIACCRGIQQKNFVNWLAGQGTGRFEVHKDERGVARIGNTDMSHSSWTGLRDRLIEAGFAVETKRGTEKVNGRWDWYTVNTIKAGINENEQGELF